MYTGSHVLVAQKNLMICLHLLISLKRYIEVIIMSIAKSIFIKL